MNTQSLEFHRSLTSARDQALKSAIKAFQGEAIEAHVSGSVGRGDPDTYSDLDVWFTFEDEVMPDVLARRFEYYSMIGEVMHVCEAPQNAPVNGVYSFVLYRTSVGLLQMDISLCPQSTSFQTKGSRRIFGEIDLPERDLSYNPKSVGVDEAYRIDFVITFVFMAIKNMVRGQGLGGLFIEYGYLSERYGIVTDPLTDREHSFDTLGKVIANLRKVSNDRQKRALLEIESFSSKVRTFFYTPGRSGLRHIQPEAEIESYVA